MYNCTYLSTMCSQLVRVVYAFTDSFLFISQGQYKSHNKYFCGKAAGSWSHNKSLQVIYLEEQMTVFIWKPNGFKVCFEWAVDICQDTPWHLSLKLDYACWNGLECMCVCVGMAYVMLYKYVCACMWVHMLMSPRRTTYPVIQLRMLCICATMHNKYSMSQCTFVQSFCVVIFVFKICSRMILYRIMCASFIWA